jgi:hypothetical protein
VLIETAEKVGNVRRVAVTLTAPERAWGALTAALATWSLLAVGLAQVGLFRGWALLVAGLFACGIGWLALRSLKVLRCLTPRREVLFLAVILVASLLLFSWPSEHFPLMGDAAIYPNTAAMLIRTGGLTYHYDPLDELTMEQKQLLYVPSDRQLPNIQIQSYKGLLYGAYYVMDPEQNTIVSSRPPLAITWMGLFGMLSGAQGMLYVTPLFGVASLVTVYFLGKRVFDAGTGALAALWLLLSFPQLYFARTPYAEVVGQFFVLTALYALVAYWQTRRLTYLVAGIGAFTAAFAARIDILFALFILFFFFALLAVRRDWKGLAASAASLVAAIGFALWTVNRPYVGATRELMLAWQFRFLHRLDPGLVLGLSIGSLLGLVLLVLLVRRVGIIRLWQFARWGFSLAAVLGVVYALHIRPLMPEYALVNGELFPTHDEELMAVTAQYLSPLFFWLASLGVVLVLWQNRIRLEQLLLTVFVASLGAVFFWQYTTARVYPVALRRLVSEVLPGFALFGAFALRRLGQRPRWRWAAMGVAGLMMVLLMSVSGRYWFHQGAVGAWDSLDLLADHIPPEAVVLFEPQQDGSIVGWFAAPLWSFYQRHALLLNSEETDAATLQDAICFWQSQGREIYVVSQNDPSGWWPGEFQGRREGEVVWDSSIIGQSLRFPPYIWRFAFTFSIWGWEGTSCSS